MLPCSACILGASNELLLSILLINPVELVPLLLLPPWWWPLAPLPPPPPVVVTTDDDVDADDAMVDNDAIDAIDKRRADDGGVAPPPLDCLRDADALDFDLDRGDGDEPDASTAPLMSEPLESGAFAVAPELLMHADDDEDEADGQPP